MTRAATTLAGPCTGAPRRDFLLGLRHGQLAGAHVPSWCSRHGVDAGCSQRAGPPGELTTCAYQTLAEGTGVDAPQRPWCARVEVLNITRGRRPWVRLAPSVWIWRRASSRSTEPMPQERLCSARGCGGARFARSWRPSPPCTVAMQACGSAHYWAREI